MSQDVTELLLNWRGGNKAALDELIPLVHDELHKLASKYLLQERSEHTLQTTALVNEAYLRLVKISSIDWQNRAHFFAIAAQLMRNILVDYARRRKADKRFDPKNKISLESLSDSDQTQLKNQDVDIIALDDALASFASIDPRQSLIIELRFFGGLSVEEIAEGMSLSTKVVRRELQMGKLWLLCELSKNNQK